MATERVKFTFPPDLVNQPVIYNMGKQFGVVTNIRRANLSHDRGWVILEVVGNIMVLSNLVSEYLIGAVQGAIIIIAMLVQRGLQREA